ncbi:MAG: glycosyltransferase family 4 protein [Treponema sp.]|nr:glycosyltransferase family 4 protein [Treponema sp.]
MINSSILIVNNSPEYSDGIYGGAVISKRNENIIKNVFKSVYIYNHIYHNKSRIKIFLQSIFGISNGLNRYAQKQIVSIAKKNCCDYIFLGFSTLGALAKRANKKGIKVITFFHNVEYNYFNDRISKSSIFIKFVSIFIKKSIKKNEKKAVVFSNKIIVLNERDSYEIEKIYKRKADIYLPITFNDSFDEIKAIKQSIVTNNKTLLFVGSDFFGNTEGLFWFIENCLDNINAELIVVGSGMDKYKKLYPQKAVTFKGFVDDLSMEYYKSDLVVLPILSGSGMKTKTCEALMFGKTIVATREAFEGYCTEVFEKKAGFLCNSSDEFINIINQLIMKQTSKLNYESRNIFKEKYETLKYVTILEQKLTKGTSNE